MSERKNSVNSITFVKNIASRFLQERALHPLLPLHKVSAASEVCQVSSSDCVGRNESIFFVAVRLMLSDRNLGNWVPNTGVGANGVPNRWRVVLLFFITVFPLNVFLSEKNTCI